MNEEFEKLWEKLHILATLLSAKQGYDVDISRVDDKEKEAIFFNIRIMKERELKDDYYG